MSSRFLALAVILFLGSSLLADAGRHKHRTSSVEKKNQGTLADESTTTTTTQTTTKQQQRYGGTFGNPITTCGGDLTVISSIKIRYNATVFGLQLTMLGGNGGTVACGMHGQTSMPPGVIFFSLPLSDACVYQVEGQQTDTITQLTFYVKRGISVEVHGPYGRGGGNSFIATAPTGRCLIGYTGLATASAINSLNFIWGHQYRGSIPAGFVTFTATKDVPAPISEIRYNTDTAGRLTALELRYGPFEPNVIFGSNGCGGQPLAAAPCNRTMAFNWGGGECITSVHQIHDFTLQRLVGMRLFTNAGRELTLGSGDGNFMTNPSSSPKRCLINWTFVSAPGGPPTAIKYYFEGDV